MLLIFDAARTVCYVYLFLSYAGKRHTQGKREKGIAKKCFADSVELVYPSESKFQKSEEIENGVCRTNNLPTETHKSFPIYCILRGKTFKAYFNIFIFH